MKTPETGFSEQQTEDFHTPLHGSCVYSCTHWSTFPLLIIIWHPNYFSEPWFLKHPYNLNQKVGWICFIIIFPQLHDPSYGIRLYLNPDGECQKWPQPLAQVASTPTLPPSTPSSKFLEKKSFDYLLIIYMQFHFNFQFELSMYTVWDQLTCSQPIIRACPHFLHDWGSSPKARSEQSEIWSEVRMKLDIHWKYIRSIYRIWDTTLCNRKYSLPLTLWNIHNSTTRNIWYSKLPISTSLWATMGSHVFRTKIFIEFGALGHSRF